MCPKLVLSAMFGLLVFGLAGQSAVAEDGESIEKLREEIRELKVIIIKVSEKLDSVEKRLTSLERGRVPALRFPIEVERAMMGDTIRFPEAPNIRPLRR